MADVNANIGVQIDTSAALAQLKALQREIGAFNTAVVKSSSSAMMKQRDIAIDLMRNVSASGKFSAELTTIKTSTEAFTSSLENNKLTLKEYFRYGIASTKTFGKVFSTEFETISKVARERTKDLQTRYVKMGRDASGAMKAIAIRPLVLDMENYGTQAMMAAQRQQLFNQLLKQGSTQLLNFGKNTQWAGRQLMVGFTIPLSMLGTLAARTFMDMEKEVIKFKRVYGDMFTSSDETEKALSDVMNLGKEFTKYGVALKDTVGIAAEAAQAGFAGSDLIAQTANASKLAVLGQVEQQQALETTISLQNAFGISAENLAGSIDFLNAVENQTVTAIEDLTIAIPKAGPVVKQLGGDVKDLAFFLTAMKEGGINASEGANALKSGLASLINPAEKSAKFLAEMGININAIVEGNKGNIRETVIDFARALDTLDPLNRARAIEQLFGKFQFARLSTLFQNVTKEGTQASRVLDLAGRSVEQLAILSERELGAVENAVGVKFTAAVENLKKELMPLGKAFLEAATPVIKFVSNMLEKFNNLSDGTKKMVAIITAVIGAIGPVLLMTFGLVANGVANLLKLFASLRNGYLRLSGNTKTLGLETSYMTSEQIKNATAAASLEQTHSRLTQIYTGEASALNKLVMSLQTATKAQRDFAITNPRSMVPGFKPGKAGKFNKGTTNVPGPRGAGDVVNSMLSPGEAVIPADTAQKPENKSLIAALVAGKNIRAYENGTIGAGLENRVNVDKLPSGYSKAPDAVVDAKLKAIDDFYFGNPPGSRSEFDNEFAKATSDEQKKMQMLKSSYTKNRDKVRGIISDPSKVVYKDGMFGVVGPGGKGWSLMPDKTFESHFNYISGKGKIDGRLSSSGFTPSRFLRRMPTKPPTGSPTGLKKNVMASLDKNQRAALRKESSWIQERLAKSGVTSKTDVANYSKLDLAHLEKPGTGSDKWKAGKVTPDTGLINKYIQYRVQTNGPSKLEQALQKIEKDPALARSMGMDRGKVAILKNAFAGLKSSHPTTAGDFKKLRAIADFEDLVASKNPKLLGKMKNPGVLGQVVRDYVDEFKKKGTSGKRPVVDLSSMAKSSLAKIRSGGRSTDTQLALLGKDEGVLTQRGVANVSAMAGTQKGAVNLVNKIKGRADGFDPTDPLQNKAMTYGTTGQIDPIQRGLRKQREKELALARKTEKAEKQRLSALQKTTKVTTETINAQISAKDQIRMYSGKVAVGAGAVSGLTLAASFAGGKLGAIASSVLPFAFALQGIAAALPLLLNPWVAAVAAVVAIGTVAWKLNKDLETARKAGVELAKSMSMTSDKLQSLSEITGTVSASQEAEKRREDSLAGDTYSQRKYGQNILESDFGKGLLSDINAQSISGASQEEIGKNIANQLSYSVLQGVVTTDQAKSIASALGTKLKDFTIPAVISGEIVSMFGPNGENLLTDPLKIALELQAEGQKTQSDAFNTALAQRKDTIGLGAVGAMVAGGAAVGNVPGAVVGGAAGLTALLASNKTKAENLKLDAAAVQLGIETITQNQGIADSLNQQFDARLKTAKTQVEINRIEDERRNSLDALNASNKQYLQQLIDQKEQLDPSAFNKAMADSVSAMYKDGPMKTFADSAIESLNDMKDSEFKTMLQIEFASGTLDPLTVNNLVNMAADGTDMSVRYNALVNVAGSSADASLLFQLLAKAGVSNENLPVYIDLLISDPKKITGNKEALEVLSSIRQKYGINIDVNDDGPEQIASVREAVEGLSNMADDQAITFEMASKIEDPFMKTVMNNWDTLVGDGKTITKKIILDFIALQDSQTVDNYMVAMGITAPKGRLGVIQRKALEDDAAAYYASGQGKTPPGEVPGGGQGGGGAGKTIPTSPLDDLLKKLKDVRNNTITVTKGFDASQKALNKIFGSGKTYNVLSGIEQDLIKIGAQGDFIELIVGMDPDEFEKRKKNLFKFDNAGNIIGLKKDAQAISAAIAAINIGNFQADNAKVLKQAQEQDKAYKTLKTAGVEAATAIELVKDQTLATAIATGSISSKKLKEISELISRINKDIPAMETSRLLETKDGQIEVFEKGYSSALERFSVLEAAIDLSYSDKIKGLQDQIEASSKKISGMNEEIANYNYELEEIDEKEKAITKTFDDRLVALDQIREANAESVRQQKQQLTIAGALSQGDIAAAAAAVQEMRAQNAEAAQDRLQKGLEQAKENAILGVTNSLGLTRLQIEEKIKALKAQIRKEEEEVLKIKQKDLEDTNKIIDAEKEKLTVAKLTKEEWTKIKSGVDLAKTSGDAFDLAISNALTAAKALSKEWNEFKDKTVYLNIVQRYVSQAEAEEGVTPKEKTEKTDADKKTTSNQDTGSDALKTLSQSKTTAEINNSVKKAVASGSSASKIANTMVAPLIASGVSTASALSTARYTGQAIAWQQQQDAKAKIVKKSSGGMIPKRFAIGGYAMGTDTVPAMLTPGEFVMSKYAVNNAGIDNMKAINSGASIGDSVYNYQVSVNVKSDSNPDEIARVVMGQIKQVESKRLRGNRI